jgi:hypothetical protein
LPTAVNGSISTTTETTTGNAASVNGPTNPKTDGTDESRVSSLTSYDSSAANEPAANEPASNELVAPAATAVLVDVGGVE